MFLKINGQAINLDQVRLVTIDIPSNWKNDEDGEVWLIFYIDGLKPSNAHCVTIASLAEAKNIIEYL